jgi:hypothetical protein
VVVLLLLLIVAVFAGAFLLRVGGARRAQLAAKWPSLFLGVAALILILRGAWQPAVAVAGCAWLLWMLWPPNAGPERAAREAAADAEARATLGVGAGATEAEIRDAFRERMRYAHPDRGGSHALAARITAARDRLIRRGR